MLQNSARFQFEPFLSACRFPRQCPVNCAIVAQSGGRSLSNKPMACGIVEACLTDEKPRDVVACVGRPFQWSADPSDSGFASPSIASSMSSTPRRRPTGCPIPGSAKPAIRLSCPHRAQSIPQLPSVILTRLLAGTAGCTHLTELCAILPTADDPGVRRRRMEHR